MLFQGLNGLRQPLLVAILASVLVDRPELAVNSFQFDVDLLLPNLHLLLLLLQHIELGLRFLQLDGRRFDGSFEIRHPLMQVFCVLVRILQQNLCLGTKINWEKIMKDKEKVRIRHQSQRTMKPYNIKRWLPLVIHIL